MKDAAPSTHRYKYAQSGSSACDQSTGVFYLTIAEKAIVSNDIIEKFCRATLPKSVNLDYLLGANMPGSWAVKTNDFETAVPIASYITGGKVLDIAKYSEATYSKGDGTIVFEFTPGPGACITGAHTVTIKLTNDLTL